MPNTTTWGITYPDQTSSITPLESHFSAVATTTDTALTTLKSNIRGADSSSTIASLSSSIATINSKLGFYLQTGSIAPTGVPANNGPEGSMYWDSTSNILYVYNSSSWKPIYGSTAWQNITVNATFAAGSVAPQYRIIGDVVYFRGAFASTGMTAGTPAACGQLPAAAYPAQTLLYTNSTSSTTRYINKVSVSAVGVITITPESLTGTPNHYINFSYPLG
jgi:hypothetical protein